MSRFPLLRLLVVCAALLLPPVAGGTLAADPATGPSLSLTGKLHHPGQFDLAALTALPSQNARVSFQTEHGAEQADYTGVLLWTLLTEAGGLDDAEKGAVLRHVVKITGRDGYFVVLSTGEIAPDFGAKPAMIAYRRDNDSAGAGGFRLVVPGDKRGGRNVRDVVAVDVE